MKHLRLDMIRIRENIRNVIYFSVCPKIELNLIIDLWTDKFYNYFFLSPDEIE